MTFPFLRGLTLLLFCVIHICPSCIYVLGFCSQRNDALQRRNAFFSAASRADIVETIESCPKIATWEERIGSLNQFIQEHGHTRVTYKLTENKPQYHGLSDWVTHQRTEYRKRRSGKHAQITEERIKLLNELGFQWNPSQETWDRSFKELVKYKAEHGHTAPPGRGNFLGRWASRQRSDYRASTLSQERVDALNSIGFVWDVSEWKFQRRLDQLRAFSEKHGHFHVGTNDGELGIWLGTQLKEYRKWLKGKPTKLSESRRLALEEIGFGPDLKKRRSEEPYTFTSWDDRFKQLEDYKAEHGHVLVPKQYGSLGAWVVSQRFRKSSLSEERIKKLEDIGFVWNMFAWKWDQQLLALAAFREEYGHTNVPSSFNSTLGSWVKRQRHEYVLFQQGKKSHLNAEKVGRLLGLGFCFDLGSSMKVDNDNRWSKRFNELQRFKEEHGHVSVPRSQGSLGRWVMNQRYLYKNTLRGEKTQLTPERVAKLDGIGLFDTC